LASHGGVDCAAAEAAHIESNTLETNIRIRVLESTNSR
jgi:hypothetical protein